MPTSPFRRSAKMRGMERRVLIRLLALLASWATGTSVRAEEPLDPPNAAATGPDPASVAFFEAEVRPILVERCQSCHGPSKAKADLRLDSRAAIVAGGESGPAIVPGQPG